MPTCSAKGCRNNHKNGARLHHFPRDTNRRKLWASVCCISGFEPNDSSVLCSEHFDEHQFENKRLDGRKLLKWNAVPSVIQPASDHQQKKRKIIPECLSAVEDFQPSTSLTEHLQCGFKTSHEDAHLQQIASASDDFQLLTTPVTDQMLALVQQLPEAVVQQSIVVQSEPVLGNGTCFTQPTLLQLLPPTSVQFAYETPVPGNRLKKRGNIACQTPTTLSSSTPRKEALRRRLAVHRVKNSRLKRQNKMWRHKFRQLRNEMKCQKTSVDVQHILSVTKNILTADGQALFSTQLKLATVTAKGRRYTNEMKNLALLLHYKGAKAYRFLSSIFTLPSKSSLHLWVQNLNVLPGLSSNVWEVLKLRVESLNPRDRVCAVLMDEMALKVNLAYSRYGDFVVGFEDFGDGKRSDRLANSALVFMVRGLAFNWKQPLGYVLTSSSAKSDVIKSLLLSCLDKLQAIGLQVVVVISDQGSNFQQLVRNLGACPDKPYFVHNGIKYCYMYDPPHLLKSIRNNLQKYSFVFDDGEKTACWADIVSFFNVDHQQRFRLAPRLTPKHIELPAFSKMKVKLAAQVLSRSVASGLESHAMLKCGHGSDTAEFVAVFDELFDSMNSSQRNCIKTFKCAMSSNSGHVRLFQQRLEWFKSLHVVDSGGKDVTGIVKCVAGWQLTLSSVIHLWHRLRSEFNFEFLLTRRLNQDSLENFFSVIRQRGGSCVNPTSILFCRLFRQVCCNTLFKPVVGANCELDCAAVLATLTCDDRRAVQLASNTSAPTQDRSVDHLVDLAMTCTNENELEDNGLSYVAGFFVRRLLKWHPCSVCESVLVSKESLLNDSRNVYTNCRLYEPNEIKGGKGLVFVSSEFFVYIQQLEEMFAACYKKHSYAVGICQIIVNELEHHPLPNVCQKFPKLQFLRYFVRVRIYYRLKFTDVAEKKTAVSSSKNRKLRNLKHE